MIQPAPNETSVCIQMEVTPGIKRRADHNLRDFPETHHTPIMF